MAIAAGFVAALIGIAYFFGHDLAGRGVAGALDWGVMLPVLFVYTLVAGPLGGRGIGGGLRLATRAQQAGPNLVRGVVVVMVGAMIGASVVGVSGAVLFDAADGPRVDPSDALASRPCPVWWTAFRMDVMAHAVVVSLACGALLGAVVGLAAWLNEVFLVVLSRRKAA